MTRRESRGDVSINQSINLSIYLPFQKGVKEAHAADAGEAVFENEAGRWFFPNSAVRPRRSDPCSCLGQVCTRESIAVRESTRVVLGDIPKKGVVRCSLDSCLLLSSIFAFQVAISPLNDPPLMLTSIDSRCTVNADLYRLPM